MIVGREIFLKNIFLVLAFVCSLTGIYLTSDSITHVFIMCIFSFLPMYMVKFDILHPYVWFSGIFCLYSISLPILYDIGAPYLRAQYTKETMIFQIVFLFFVLSVVTAKKINYKKLVNYSLKNLETIGYLNKISLLLMTILILLCIGYLNLNGFTGKGSIYAENNIIINIIFRFPLIIMIIYPLLTLSEYNLKQKIPKKMIIYVGLLLLLFSLFTGERDFFFRYIVISLMMLNLFNAVKAWYYFIGVPLLVFIFILSHQFKYYFSAGIISETNDSFLINFLAGEFVSASSNLQVLIDNKMDSYFGINVFFKDLLSMFYLDNGSLGSWFHKTFYSFSRTEYGFSIVGEGYVIGGVWGIIFSAIIFGLVILFFYRKSVTNIYWLVSYMYLSTLCMYTIRSGFGTLFSGIIKQIGFVLIVVWVLEILSKKD